MRTITDAELGTLSTYMNDEIRESVHFDMTPCTANEFLEEYLNRDPLFMKIVKDVIGGI